MRIRRFQSSPEREEDARKAESGALGGGATSQKVQATLEDGESEETNYPLWPAEGRESG